MTELYDQDTEGETVHLCPPSDSNVMPCCGLTPSQVPLSDRLTLQPGRVTCRRHTILKR